MTITKTYCDHCGKVLDNIVDYIDLDIDICCSTHTVDLCKDCLIKLDEKLAEFCKRSDTE